MLHNTKTDAGRDGSKIRAWGEERGQEIGLRENTGLEKRDRRTLEA